MSSIKCRLCQLRTGFEELIETSELGSKILYCTNIQIRFSVDSILVICNECKITIENFYVFLKYIQKVDEELNEQLREIKTEQSSKAVKNDQCLKCYKTFDNNSDIQHACHNNELYVESGNEDVAEINEITSEINEKSIDLNEERTHIIKVVTEINETVNETNKSIVESSKILKDRITDPVKIFEVIKVKEKENFKCKMCPLEFRWRVDLWVHQKTHDKFMCSWRDCMKICSSAYSLKTHEMKHEGKCPYLCVTCGKGFITRNSLNCHEKIHLAVKDFKCKICNIAYSVRSNLRAHEKKHHEGVRFYCSQCTRAFISKCSLDRHEKLHTGIREFQCETCPSAFYTNKELLKHQRYHQGLKQHKCDICYKAFFEKHHLTIHLRSHSGERPYTCKMPGCNKSFAESQKLTRHQKARHPPA